MARAKSRSRKRSAALPAGRLPPAALSPPLSSTASAPMPAHALRLALFETMVLVERPLIPWHISERVPLQGRTSPWEPASCPSHVIRPPL